MNLQRLWCLLVIMAFSMPVFAVAPYQIDSFDDFNNIIEGPNWVETTGGQYASYVEQVLVGAPNEVTEGAGSMKFDFPSYVTGYRDDEVKRVFSPALDWDSNWEELAITLWVWSENIDDSRSQTAGSRLREIVLYDSTVGPQAHVGHFTMPCWRYRNTPPLKNVGWNKVIAPLRNFMWKDGIGLYDFMDPCDAEWDKITKIGLLTRTEHTPPQNAIYIDDMRLEVAPAPPPRYTPPSQIASCDDINDELWDELRGTGVMLQTPPGDANLLGWKDPNGSMMIDFTIHGISKPDITPVLYFIPALDFSTDYNDWAITMWVWTDLVLDSKIKEIILHDAEWNLGRFRVPLTLSEGWNKVTARIDEFLWNETGDDNTIISPDLVRLDAILSMELWTECYPDPGNAIYLDDFRFEPAVEALSEAVVYNADYGTITVDGDASDWAGLVDSDILDFDMQAVKDPNGNLHVKYRLAWDPNYLYILVEELPGDTEAYEAANYADFANETVGVSEWYDSLALYFDFKNCRWPGIGSHINFYLFLGLSSTGRTDLMYAWTNGLWGDQGGVDPAAIANGSVATSGTLLGSRVIEAKISWQDLDDRIYSWLLPEGGLKAAAVKPGYIFGIDPRLCDSEGEGAPWTTLKGVKWLSGGHRRQPDNCRDRPNGRDPNSTDVRLVCSAGDLDFDCDVDFVDYAQFAAEWYETDCNNLNDFCNGADIIIDGTVTLDDLDRFTERWLD